MKSTNYYILWILIATIITINQANKIGLKDNSTWSKKIVKRRLNHDDQLLDDLNDDSDGTSFYFLPPKTLRGTANRYVSRYIQESSANGNGDLSYLESDEEIKPSSLSSTINSGRSSILPNGRPGRMRVRRVEQSSGDHLIEPHSEYNFDDIIVPNSSSSLSAKRINLNVNSTSSLDGNSNNNQRSRPTSFGTRRRVKVKETEPNREPGTDPISHFMEVDMKENEEGDKELLDPGSSEIRDTIEPRGGQQFRQTLRNSESPVSSINSGLSLDPYSRFKNADNDFEEPLPRPQVTSSDSETIGTGRQSNPQYRPNYEHYESRGGSSSSSSGGRDTIVGGGLESGFTGIIPGSSSSSSSSSSSPSSSSLSSSRHHPSLIRSTENSDPVRGIRARYFRPQTVGDYRQSNHAYISGNRLPTILIPNQDIRQQLPRPYYVTTSPPTLTSPPLYTTYSDLSLSGLSGYQSNPSSDFDLRPQRPSRVEPARRPPASHYRTMVADHLIDEDEGYNVRGITTVSPPPTRPSTIRTTRTTTTTTTPSTPISRVEPISRDYNYGYDADRTRQPNYDYSDQPIHRQNPQANQRGSNNNRQSNERSYRNQFYSQATATTTSTTTTTTTTTPKPVQRYNNNNNFERTNDRGQPPNYRSDYDSAPMTATVAPPNDSESPNSGSGFRIRPAGRPLGGRRRRKRPRAQIAANQGPVNGQNRQPTTTTTTTTTTSAPPPAPYYYDDYDDNEDYEYDYQPTTTTTVRPRRKGRRGQGGRGRQRTSTTPSTTTTTTTTTPAPTTRTLSPGYKHRADKRIIDYMADPNFPHELKGADLTDYPFYISLPTEINFNCEGRHDGYYASIEHKCQVYHHCAIGHRYDFLCPNYTLFDQTTFTCRFVNTVDCLKSENHFNRNDDLYVETTEKPENNDKKIQKEKEKERNKRDEEEAIKSEASSRINESPIVSTQSTLTTTINYTTNSNHDNRSDNFSNKTKVKNKLDKRLKKVS
ncbi:LOW QUALITY PROTEIN: mucin-5AC-like [Panonychus citri]|uniref:LOW QUALITY PROTEIN: mucin-5AC-like n=1 Tax=Panonychus citri TaxID=50023 RepID=UPI0023072131|nr:LOW QUALITY PROTEIN: mucin-5AC-like [Panonychus citri]